ncbi:GNAT family N-acetyltransferase [Paenibacillus lignilyticus]|uniref:GNAT family N-acetyltransferase n=1 Tax=Paenibacillus lignilyticus TaxID=1172615 RepID=A0ABS5CFF1_9BACL|nr:GNAT family N-acetyltransferase [Paenibacillus lignilyticus]MBP3964608.1 GNAT family N-acetyltransferase [Paenibacillus lignilyticus]
MGNITIEVVRDDNIEPCRALCNELMAFQQSKATMLPEVFDAMNFDTRMKRSYDQAPESQVIVAKDDGVPIGYVFSTIDQPDERSRNAYPDWAPRGGKGFYPNWDDLPAKIGCLNNLYVRDGYRAMKLGSKLFDMSIDWLESSPNVDIIFIYVSNGNDAALNFYLSRGFTYSHEVFGGFIKAVYKFTRK